MNLQDLFEGRSNSAPADKFKNELVNHLVKFISRPAKDEKKLYIDSFHKHSIQSHGNRVALSLNAYWVNLYMFNVFKSKSENFNEISQDFIERISKNLNKIAKSYGWAIANVTINKDGDEKNIHFVFFPERSSMSRLTDVPEFLYHITTSNNVNGILKKGLIPKSAGPEAIKHEGDFGSFGGMFKNKIFVLNHYSKEAAENAFYNLYKDGSMEVIEIETAKLPKSIKFFHDETFLDDDNEDVLGYWTKTPIPPEALKVKK